MKAVATSFSRILIVALAQCPSRRFDVSSFEKQRVETRIASGSGHGRRVTWDSEISSSVATPLRCTTRFCTSLFASEIPFRDRPNTSSTASYKRIPQIVSEPPTTSGI